MAAVSEELRLSESGRKKIEQFDGFSSSLMKDIWQGTSNALVLLLDKLSLHLPLKPRRRHHVSKGD